MPNGHHDIFDEEWFRLWKELEDLYFNRPPFEERNGPDRPFRGDMAPREQFHSQRFAERSTTAIRKNWDAFRHLMRGEGVRPRAFKPAEWGVIFRQMTDRIMWLRLPDNEDAQNPIQPASQWNLYPSDLSGPCQPKGVFFAVDAPEFGMKRKETLDLQTALHAMVQRAQGRCAHVNKEIVLVTTSWDARIVGPWQGNLNNFPGSLRVFLWTGQTWTHFDPRH